MKNLYSIDELAAFRDIVADLNTMHDLRQLNSNPSIYLANLQLNNLYFKLLHAITRCTLERRTKLKFNLNLKDRLALMVFKNAKLELGIYERNFITQIFIEIQASF